MNSYLLEKIIAKAATKKKDGVYTLGSAHYAVVKGRLYAVSGFDEMFLFSYGFLVSAGKCERWSFIKKKILRDMIKKELKS